MRVLKWGNSLAIRLPAAVVESLGLREGVDVTLRVSSKRARHARELLARLRRFRGRLPKNFKFDRLEASKRS
ncbi:AbrB/MazE/SpoVT family DNA-binding domain-containing protein [Steroidobacter flavus]|uniref:AbrB/MazE/SpoVT family DNA-binding domain-containing protein n=1 Tax=Steroidobacter flavus TaxID=1842136 RepID=A0ABV8SKX3_9GAMM